LLNVRSAPETGLVVSNLSNGTRVRILQEVSDERGRRWAFVGEAAGERRTIGWVFRTFLRCN
jgi:predicted thioesterase